MNLYFLGDTDQRAYIVDGTQSQPSYTYSGSLRMCANMSRLDGNELFSIGRHHLGFKPDYRFNLRFYNAARYLEN